MMSRPSVRRTVMPKVRLLIELCGETLLVSAHDELGFIGVRTKGGVGQREQVVEACKQKAVEALEGPCQFTEMDLVGESGDAA